MGLDLVKFKFGKGHGSRKSGEVVNTPRSTADALKAHGIGSYKELEPEEREEAVKPVVKVKDPKKGKAKAIGKN